MIELGAGTGLAGMVASALGNSARPTALNGSSDYNKLQIISYAIC